LLQSKTADGSLLAFATEWQDEATAADLHHEQMLFPLQEPSFPKALQVSSSSLKKIYGILETYWKRISSCFETVSFSSL
jgi:hypothetical protein